MFCFVILIWAPAIGFFFPVISHPVGTFDSSSSRKNALTCPDIWSRQSEFNAVQGPVAPGLHPLSFSRHFGFPRGNYNDLDMEHKAFQLFNICCFKAITVVLKFSVQVVVCYLNKWKSWTTCSSRNHIRTAEFWPPLAPRATAPIEQ